MLMLILKDFKIVRKLTLFITAVCFVYIVIFTLLDISKLSSYALVYMMCYSFTNRLLYEDDRSNGFRLLMSLPLRRWMIVCARYCTVLLVTCAPVLLSWAAVGLVRLFAAGMPAVSAVNAPVTVTVLMAGILIISSIHLPLYYALGYKKSSAMFTFIFAAVMIFIFFGESGSSVLPGGIDITAAGMLTGTQLPVLLLSASGLFVLSAAISLVLFKKRDLFA